MSSTEDASIEGLVYTPHGINAEDLRPLSLASPQINVLALLHGLHDIRISKRQLNLGAHNALRAQRISGSRYWLSTHDEVKKAGGLVNHFLRRKIWTMEDVLKEEKRRNETLDIGSPLADIRDIHFANLETVFLGQPVLMGFLKAFRGNHPETIGGENSQNYAPPPGPPPSHGALSQEYHAPPPGPPPGQNEYPPPPGPPPQHRASDDPPPYHDWTVIPDTALLPPPPSIGHEASPAGNASLSDADRAHVCITCCNCLHELLTESQDWCRTYPLLRPHQPAALHHDSVNNGNIELVKSREFQGGLSKAGLGSWKGSTVPGGRDACLLGSLPCYFAFSDSPLVTGIKKVIYFEVKVLSYGGGRGGDASSMALGWSALPYPTWRMPGWERGSLAVHGDDGRRYVNDTWGGKDFTNAIQAGQTVGLGMEFSIPDTPPDYGSSPAQTPSIKVDVFFTRDGVKESGWSLHEELDAQNDLGVGGLDGQFDLYAAVGLFGAVEFEVNFNRNHWLWQPS
ncbi:MAG: hypothetical protein L6R38_005334 [Xanthoria sp. 2 TBL-2021]|nr:MAG: hypothetical protein L6R38_005334 [Xanthoria sp. 2 TBL-2021]